MNAAAADAAGMVTEAGTVSFALLLARATVTPPFGAGPDNVTLQESAAGPVMEVLLHESELIVAAEFESVPVPVRGTVKVPALLDMVK